MRRIAAAAVSLVLVAVLGACGVPASGGADRAKPDDVPFDLLDPNSAPPDGVVSLSGVRVEIFLYDPASGLLAPVSRRVDDGTITSVLGELERSPSELGAGEELRNALGETDVIASVTVERGLATVDLSASFSEISAVDQLPAIAQIVYTATGRPGIGQVTFTLEGEPVDVPTGNGRISRGTLTRGDYAEFNPPT